MEALDIPLPRENHRLFGHDSAEAALFEACKAGRLHHSQLFAGPRGIGKSTLAYRLARHLLKAEMSGGLFELNLHETQGFNVLPEDSVFKEIAAGGHPALRIVERKRNLDTGKTARDITVGDIRELSDFFRMTTVAGGWRVAIVDPADAMNQNAANALLKILEEPPERSVIILISHAPGQLLPTIRSRCNVLHMSPPRPEEFMIALEALKLFAPKRDHDLLAELSAGSIGDAVTLLQLDGLTIYRKICSLIDRRIGGFDTELHAFGDQLAQNGQEDAFELFARLMQRVIGDKIVLIARQGAMAQAGGELDRWLDVWEKVRVLLSQAVRLGLDRKHVVLNAFSHVSSVVAGPGTR